MHMPLKLRKLPNTVKKFDIYELINCHGRG